MKFLGKFEGLHPGNLLPFLFLPYFVVYVLFWQFGYSTLNLLVTYWILHLVIIPPILFAAIKHAVNIDRASGLFWLLLLLVCIGPGVYLELPSDPWAHLRNIYLWNVTEKIWHHPNPLKAFYFFTYSFVGKVPTEYRFLALSLFSGLSQWLLLAKLSQVLQTLGFNRSLRQIQLIATLFLFGTNIFNIRYYGISTTLFSYYLYLSGLLILLRSESWNKPRVLVAMGSLSFMILLSHIQELVFLLLSGLAIWMVKQIQNQRMKTLIFASALILVLTIFASLFPELYVSSIKMIPGAHGVREWSAIKTHFTWLSLPYLAGDRTSIHETLALPGALSLLFSLILFKKHPKACLLTLMPSLFVIWPPLNLLVSSIREPYIVYRVLLAFPTAVIFATGVFYGIDWLVIRGWSEKKKLSTPLTLLLILIVSFVPTYPLRGRAWFHFYIPKQETSLNSHLELEDFVSSPDMKRLLKCRLATDHATANYLWAHHSFFYYNSPFPPAKLNLVSTPSTDKRRNPESMWHHLKNQAELQKKLTYYEVCMILVANESMTDRYPGLRKISKAARYSKHWPSDYFKRAIPLPDSTRVLIDGLAEIGWTKRQLSPSFTLWSAPAPSH